MVEVVAALAVVGADKTDVLVRGVGVAVEDLPASGRGEIGDTGVGAGLDDEIRIRNYTGSVGVRKATHDAHSTGAAAGVDIPITLAEARFGPVIGRLGGDGEEGGYEDGAESDHGVEIICSWKDEKRSSMR